MFLRIRQPAKAVLLSLLLIACSNWLQAQAQPDNRLNRLDWSTDSTGRRRFISAHGRRAAIFGYSQDGLEVWAYPFQICSSYSISFRPQGTTTPIDSETLLRRIVYSPDAVTRIYVGPDFIVREKLFVPLDEPGASITYDVDGARPVDIMIRFVPVLDLMWPASVGGQEAAWNSASSAFLLSEATHRFTASVGSPDIVAHDETPNISRSVASAPGLAFTIRASGSHTARVIISGSDQGRDATTIARKLLERSAAHEKAAADHYSALLSHNLEIETPDANTNRALAWSEIALDQAWVCNPDLGCGLVAGYGSSRKARRPQYDWFFAGDGMVTVHALLAAGEYERARQELEFILKYQDQKSGMIWHELSQSAGWVDWGKYPYMFVHVDLTFDFLETVGSYYSATGDLEFVKSHWTSIDAAFQYCRSLLDPKDGLPRIPAEKRGQREQDELSDELALSANWVTASQAFSRLAEAMGSSAEAEEASAMSQKASRAVADRYWDKLKHAWISGYTRSGTPLMDHNLGPARGSAGSLISQSERDALLDQLASADFEADWGTRGRASSASTYAPNSYASGSVWATGTSGAATTFWAEHRPATALPIWSALVPWSSLDSLGHLHEALAGDYYHEEVESVPEQTWSSATFFTAAVEGMLGLRVDGVSNRVTFAPHLPSTWGEITLRHVPIAKSEISFNLVQSADETRLQIQNDGAPVLMVFDPEIPFGAKLRGARVGDQSVVATFEPHSQDNHAKVAFTLPHGNTLLTIAYEGGVAMLPAAPQLLLGDTSTAIKITGVTLKDQTYIVDFDYVPSVGGSFDIRTPWSIKSVQGATLQTISHASYRLTVAAPASEKRSQDYQHRRVTVAFARGR